MWDREGMLDREEKSKQVAKNNRKHSAICTFCMSLSGYERSFPVFQGRLAFDLCCADRIGIWGEARGTGGGAFQYGVSDGAGKQFMGNDEFYFLWGKCSDDG